MSFSSSYTEDASTSSTFVSVESASSYDSEAGAYGMSSLEPMMEKLSQILKERDSAASSLNISDFEAGDYSLDSFSMEAGGGGLEFSDTTKATTYISDIQRITEAQKSLAEKVQQARKAIHGDGKTFVMDADTKNSEDAANSDFDLEKPGLNQVAKHLRRETSRLSRARSRLSKAQEAKKAEEKAKTEAEKRLADRKEDQEAIAMADLEGMNAHDDSLTPDYGSVEKSLTDDGLSKSPSEEEEETPSEESEERRARSRSLAASVRTRKASRKDLRVHGEDSSSISDSPVSDPDMAAQMPEAPVLHYDDKAMKSVRDCYKQWARFPKTSLAEIPESAKFLAQERVAARNIQRLVNSMANIDTWMAAFGEMKPDTTIDNLYARRKAAAERLDKQAEAEWNAARNEMGDFKAGLPPTKKSPLVKSVDDMKKMRFNVALNAATKEYDHTVKALYRIKKGLAEAHRNQTQIQRDILLKAKAAKERRIRAEQDREERNMLLNSKARDQILQVREAMARRVESAMYSKTLETMYLLSRTNPNVFTNLYRHGDPTSSMIMDGQFQMAMGVRNLLDAGQPAPGDPQWAAALRMEAEAKKRYEEEANKKEESTEDQGYVKKITVKTGNEVTLDLAHRCGLSEGHYVRLWGDGVKDTILASQHHLKVRSVAPDGKSFTIHVQGAPGALGALGDKVGDGSQQGKEYNTYWKITGPGKIRPSDLPNYNVMDAMAKLERRDRALDKRLHTLEKKADQVGGWNDALSLAQARIFAEQSKIKARHFQAAWLVIYAVLHGAENQGMTSEEAKKSIEAEAHSSGVSIFEPRSGEDMMDAAERVKYSENRRRALRAVITRFTDNIINQEDVTGVGHVGGTEETMADMEDMEEVTMPNVFVSRNVRAAFITEEWNKDKDKDTGVFKTFHKQKEAFIIEYKRDSQALKNLLKASKRGKSGYRTFHSLGSAKASSMSDLSQGPTDKSGLSQNLTKKSWNSLAQSPGVRGDSVASPASASSRANPRDVREEIDAVKEATKELRDEVRKSRKERHLSAVKGHAQAYSVSDSEVSEAEGYPYSAGEF